MGKELLVGVCASEQRELCYPEEVWLAGWDKLANGLGMAGELETQTTECRRTALYV